MGWDAVGNLKGPPGSGGSGSLALRVPVRRADSSVLNIVVGTSNLITAYRADGSTLAITVVADA